MRKGETAVFELTRVFLLPLSNRTIINFIYCTINIISKSFIYHIGNIIVSVPASSGVDHCLHNDEMITMLRAFLITFSHIICSIKQEMSKVCVYEHHAHSKRDQQGLCIRTACSLQRNEQGLCIRTSYSLQRGE